LIVSVCSVLQVASSANPDTSQSQWLIVSVCSVLQPASHANLCTLQLSILSVCSISQLVSKSHLSLSSNFLGYADGSVIWPMLMVRTINADNGSDVTMWPILMVCTVHAENGFDVIALIFTFASSGESTCSARLECKLASFSTTNNFLDSTGSTCSKQNTEHTITFENIFLMISLGKSSNIILETLSGTFSTAISETTFFCLRSLRLRSLFFFWAHFLLFSFVLLFIIIQNTQKVLKR